MTDLHHCFEALSCSLTHYLNGGARERKGGLRRTSRQLCQTGSEGAGKAAASGMLEKTEIVSHAALAQRAVCVFCTGNGASAR